MPPAIFKLVDSTVSHEEQTAKPVEVVEVVPGAAVILPAPSRCLRRIPCLKLAEVTPGRHLLTIVPGTAIESLEVAMLDILEGLAPDEDYERILEALRQLIGASRREQTIRKFEMLYVCPSAASRRPASSHLRQTGRSRTTAIYPARSRTSPIRSA